MQIDRRITNGLAWAGALLVVAVPAADFLAERLSGPNEPAMAVFDPVAPLPEPAVPVPAEVEDVADAVPSVAAPEPAVTAPAATATAGGDVVDTFLQSGRQMPSYISGDDSPAVVATSPAAPVKPAVTPAATPTATVTPPKAETPQDAKPAAVAAVPRKVAPIPMPLSMRPRPLTEPTVFATPAVVVPQPATAAQPVVVPEREVTAAELEDWESGPLSEFLAQRQAEGSYFASEYDANGFYLDQGPNGDGSFSW